MADWVNGTGIADALKGTWPALANHLWQSTVFALVAAGLALALRRNHARARYWIWMAASMKFVLPFALLAALGSHFAKPRVVAAPVQQTMYYAAEDFSEPFAMQAAPVAAPVAALSLLRAAVVVPLAVGVVWLCGFLAVLAQWCVRWRRVAKTLRRSELIGGGREVEALRRIEQAVGLRMRIAMRLSQSAMEPGVFGIARPLLAWPAGISARLDDVQLEAVLTHEVCRVRRRDNLTAGLHMFVEAAFWFHPLVWWLGARLMAERERACDEEVLLRCSQPRAYAESILRVCEFCVESPLPCVAGVTGADLKQRVVQIMTGRSVRKLTLAKKLILAVVAVCAVAAPLAFGVIRVAPIYGQLLHATGPLPAFDAVAIKPARPDERGMGFDLEGRHFRTINTSVSDLLQYAYGVQSRQIEGAPAWTETERYDINGVAPDSGSAEPEWKLMVQKLLADRFGFTFHSGAKDLPVYELQISKNGPKLTKSPPKPEHVEGELYISRNASGPGSTIHGKFTTMEGLAKLLEATQFDRPVVDRTGLEGNFDFEMTFMSDHFKGKPISPPAEEEPNAPAGIFTALQEQLGLKLEPAKGSAETLVIDHVERPSLDGAELHRPLPLHMYVPAKQEVPVPTQANVAPNLQAVSLIRQYSRFATFTNSFVSAMPLAQVHEKPAQASGAADAMSPIKFEVVSVRRNLAEMGPATARFDFSAKGDGLTMTDILLSSIVGTFYGHDQTAQAGMPAWANSECYDVRAKVADSDLDAYHKLSKAQRYRMVQQVLENRFKLRTHVEEKEAPMYALVVAKSGPKIVPAPAGEVYTSGPRGSDGQPQGGTIFPGSDGEQIAHAARMQMLAGALTALAGRQVVDHTGLTGAYDFTLKWNPRDTDGPSLFTALEEQLGLRLEPAKGMVEMLVIDHIERPSEN